MPQHDYDILAQKGSSFRTDLNAALAAIASNNGGPAAPLVTFPHQFWPDTTAGVLRQRNGANSSWVPIGLLDTPSWGLATAASVQALRGFTVSVLEPVYGAVGNGTADDTAAIQAALDYVDSIGGGSVYVPLTSSFYKLTAVLRVGSNTTLCGSGWLRWFTLPPTVVTGDFSGGARRAIINKNVSLSGTQNANISVEGLKIDLSLIVGALAYSRQAVFFFNCIKTKVARCHILSDGGSVLNVKTSDYLVENNYCEQVGTYASSDAVIDQWWGSKNGVVRWNTVDGKMLALCGLMLTGSDTTGGSGGTISNIKFIQNHVANIRDLAIWVEGRIDVARSIRILGNTIDTAGVAGTLEGEGIRVLTCEDVRITGNDISNCQLGAILCSSVQGEAWTRSGKSLTISDNTISNVGMARTSGSLTSIDAIECYYADKLRITGNDITPHPTAKYEYAITIDAIAVNAVISHNIIEAGAQADSINLGGNQQAMVYRNEGFKTEACGVATIAAGASSVTVTGVGLNFDPWGGGNSPSQVTITPMSIPSNMADLGTPAVSNLTQSQFQVIVATTTSQAFTFKWSVTRL
jgi:hypothetical protein